MTEYPEEGAMKLDIESGAEGWMIEEILESAPKDATHYFLVPNGSGEPYYVLEKKKVLLVSRSG